MTARKTSELMVDVPAGLTFSDPVKITQAGAGIHTLLALELLKVIRLHALKIKADAAGSVLIAYDDDGAGTNQVALTGDMPIAANGDLTIPFTRDAAACLKGLVSKQLTLVSTTSKVFGYAIVSKATA